MIKEKAFRLSEEFVRENPYTVEFSESSFPELVYASGERYLLNMIDVDLLRQLDEAREEIKRLRKELETMSDSSVLKSTSPEIMRGGRYV